MSRLVEIPVSTPEVKNGDAVLRPARDYGTFKVRIRDYDTILSVELKTDSLIAERKMNPDEVSENTRTHFYLLATFAITCEKSPEGFSLENLMFGEAGESVGFLGAYQSALAEAEDRFRQSRKAGAEPVSMV